MADQPTAVPELASSVEAELREIVGSRDMPLYDMMSYHMGWTDGQGRADEHPIGKRTHGVLCLLAAQATGGDVDTAIPAAAAIELVTNFCEIHDDVQEGSPERHGRDAVWWVWGPAQAINAGDGMHALARLALFRLQDRGVSAQTTFRAVQLLDKYSLQACEGRFLELEARERIDMSADHYLKVAALKAGSLLSCAMMLGAAAQESDAALEALSRCGESLGVAIAIQADVRALWDGEAGPTAEAMNKTKMLPVVLGPREGLCESEARPRRDIHETGLGRRRRREGARHHRRYGRPGKSARISFRITSTLRWRPWIPRESTPRAGRR